MIESEDAIAICLGDLCHHPAHFGHPAWTSAFDTHRALTPRTRGEVLGFAAARNALLLCAPALFLGLGFVRRSGHAFAWEPL